MVKTVYLIVRADQSVRLTKGMIRLAYDEVCIPVRIEFPDTWGKVLPALETIQLGDAVPLATVLAPYGPPPEDELLEGEAPEPDHHHHDIGGEG